MNRIVSAHLKNFVDSFGLHTESEADQFEKFVNYSILRPRISVDVDIDEVTTGVGDDGMDGVAVVIDEEIIFSEEDAATIFSSDRRNHDVEIVFMQAKRSDSFDLGDFLKFKESVLRFVNADQYNVLDSVQKTAYEVFSVVMQNVPKIRNGKPSFVARYVTTGKYSSPEALESANSDFRNQLEALGLFYEIDIRFIDRDELTSLWVSTYSAIKATLETFSHAPLPKIDGIEEAYLAVVKAKEFVENVLTSRDGNLMAQVFEENVRSFLGMDNFVNHSISETINSGESYTRFPVLNNGITIVSPNVIVQGNTLHLENYQIVNGCQTSNVLFENRAHLDDRMMVNLKVVETLNEDVFSELVRATNSQTKVDETQFISLRPIVKKIEQYFNTYEGQESRIFFERRDRQYVGRDIPAIRIFSVNIAAKAVTAMFIERPDLAFRYQKTMYSEFGDVIFADDIKESIFYASCISLYRLHLLVSNNAIPQNSRRYKWHLLALVRNIVCGKTIGKLNSKQIEANCLKLIDLMSQHSEQTVTVFNQALSIINTIENVTEDRLKRQVIFSEMLDKLPK